MDRWTVSIMDGAHIGHIYRVSAPDKTTAMQKVLDSFAMYGKPYGIEKRRYNSSGHLQGTDLKGDE